MVGYALHGRRALAGVAHRAPLLRPAAAGRDGRARRPQRATRVARGGRPARAGPSVETDWRALIERDDIDLVDICTPGDSHAEIAIAALEAGKHVLCEKPLANTVAEAEAMAAAAEAAAAARRPVDGRLHLPPGPGARARPRSWSPRAGSATIRHVRAQYLQDWIVDPQFPLVWRLQKDKAGSGALGDIGAHIVDLAQFVTGRAAHRGQRG